MRVHASKNSGGAGWSQLPSRKGGRHPGRRNSAAEAGSDGQRRGISRDIAGGRYEGTQGRPPFLKALRETLKDVSRWACSGRRGRRRRRRAARGSGWPEGWGAHGDGGAHKWPAEQRRLGGLRRASVPGSELRTLRTSRRRSGAGRHSSLSRYGECREAPSSVERRRRGGEEERDECEWDGKRPAQAVNGDRLMRQA